MMTMNVSALVCTYRGDNADELNSSLQSLQNQTRLPDEIVLVEDGPLTKSLRTTISEFESSSPVSVRRINHSENLGHGAARRTGIIEANSELVAIHDADDIAVPDRLECSLQEIRTSDVDVVGGYIEEFEDDPSQPYAIRKVPHGHDEIQEMAKFRSPVNHTTVLARKEAIVQAGNYRTVGQMEDYELWARMLLNGCKFKNLPRVMAKVRAGRDMYRRRGGVEYVHEEYRLQRHFTEIGFVSKPRAVVNFALRSVPKLVPGRLREQIYTKLYRSMK